MFLKNNRSLPYRAIIAVILCIVISVTFWQAIDCQFLAYDDDIYILDNHMLRLGLNLKSAAWAFTSHYAANWHPVTWFSHLLDVQLFGMNPSGHHLVNVLLHTLNSIMLFLLLHRLTDFVGRSALVAGLFALHPLHVESVAWVAERKDVLSTLFWLLSLYFYSDYARRHKPVHYILAFIMFALGLMAKPMLVTLPLVMLMLDYWPLRRYDSSNKSNNSSAILRVKSSALWLLIKEKIPFLVLVVFSSTLTIMAQHRGAALTTLSNSPLVDRIENAVVVYVRYLEKMFFPHDLAVFYPFPAAIPLWQFIGSLALVSAITMVSYRKRHIYPYLIVGWAWYIVTLIPVIGIVKVGLQGMADRYTYIPLTGIFIMLVWLVADVSKNWIYRLHLLTAITLITVSVCVVTTKKQLSYWHDTKTLFNRALSVTHDNFIAHCMLGRELEKEEKLDEALVQFDTAVAIAPWYEYARIHQGIILKYQGRLDAAVFKYNEAIIQNPDSASGHLNLGIVMARQERLEEARANFEIALKFNPQSSVGHYNMGLTLYKLGRGNESITHFFAALDIDPLDAQCRNNLGIALVNAGRFDEAIQQFSEAIRIEPGFIDAISNRELALKTIKDTPVR